MVNFLQVEKSFDESPDDNSNSLVTAVKKSEGITIILRFSHRGCSIEDGTLRRGETSERNWRKWIFTFYISFSG
jgi:hypothetical protein